MFHCTSLLLLSEIFLRFICVIVSICSILNLSSVPLCEWFKIYLFTSWRTFRLLLETFMYTGFVWIQISVSLGQIPQKQDFGVCVFNFMWHGKLFSEMVALFCISSQDVPEFQLFCIFISTWCCQTPWWSEEVTPCSFNLYFSSDEWCWASSHEYLFKSLTCFQWENVCSYLLFI